MSVHRPCRRVIKTVHTLLQSLVGIFIVIATVFAVEYKADSHGAHFWSVHAWVGAGAIGLYCLQYPLGAGTAVLVTAWSRYAKPDAEAVGTRAQGCTSIACPQ